MSTIKTFRASTSKINGGEHAHLHTGKEKCESEKKDIR